MNILYIVDYFEPSKWWVEKVFKNLSDYFSKKNNIIVLTSKFLPNIKDIEINWNIKIYRIWKNRLWFTILWSFVWLKLIKNIDLIHTSTYNSAYVTRFITLFKKIPVVLTSHEIIWYNWFIFKWKFKWRLYKKIEDFIYKFWFYYVFVSHHVKNIAVSSYNITKFSVIYNWLDISNKTNLEISKESLWFSKNDLVWVFAWRPWRTKWLDFLIRNFNNIKKINKKFKLLILLLEKDNLKKINSIKKNINTNDIKILYEIPYDEVYSYFNVADFWIVTSRSEWFWFVALEFSKLWKPCVLPFVWAIPEIAFWDCHFFKPDNDISFINSVKEIINWKKKNYSYDKKLTLDKMFCEYEKLYNKIWKI